MEYINGAFYINLDRRTDRRQEFEAECARMNISVERFPAITDTAGFLGCHRSHLQVLKIARARGYKNVLIFEDDFQFTVGKEEFESSLRTFFTSNIHYDVLMLSYHVEYYAPYNDLIGRVYSAQTASGYLVHSRFYDRLIENLETNLIKLIISGAHWDFMNDQCWKQIQLSAEWFYFVKRIGIQRSSYSDLTNRVEDYNC